MAKKIRKVTKRQVKTKTKTSKCSQSDRATKLLQQQKLEYNIKESFVKLERIDDHPMQYSLAGTSINPEYDKNAQNPNIQQTLDHDLGEPSVKLERVDDRVVYEPAHAGYNQTESDTSEFDLFSNIEIVKNEISVVDDDTLNSFRKEVEHVSRNATEIVNNTRTMNKKKNGLNLRKCDYCRKLFKQIRLRKIHETHCEQKSERKPRQYECYLCERRNPSYGVLHEHYIRFHIGGFRTMDTKRNELNPRKCDYCWKMFKQIRLRKIHETHCEQKLERNKRKYECYLCKRRYPSSGVLYKHYMKAHVIAFNCIYCARRFGKTKNYHKHVMENHLHLFKFKCKICHKVIQKKSDIEKHKESCTTPIRQSQGVIGFECSLCGSQLRRIRELNRHAALGECKNQKIKYKKRKEKKKIIVDLKQNKREPLVVHVNGKKMLKCQLCGKTSSKRFLFEKHFRTHTGETPYSCLYCNRSFSQKYGIYEHIKSVHPTEPTYRCSLCKIKLYKPDEIDEHEFKCMKRRTLECLFCKFTTKNLYLRHLKSHMIRAHRPLPPKKTFKCKFCAKNYMREGCLKLHIQTHHSRPSQVIREFECYLCKERCSSYQNLRRVHMTHHLTRFDCIYCVKKYDSAKGYKNHMFGKHLHLFKFQCKICHGIIEKSSDIRKHKDSCMEPTRQSLGVNYFECSLCRLELPGIRELKIHVLSRECKNQLKKCNRMEKKLIVKVDPEQNKLEPIEICVDGKMKMLKCPLCEITKPTVRRYEFKHHFRRHTGEKPYSCLYCNRLFSTKSSRLIHTRLSHPQKPILKCQLCRLIFFKSDEIDEHKFKCVKRRSFECLFCKFTAGDLEMGELKKHMQKAHTIRTRPFKCNICAKDYITKPSLDEHMKRCHRIPISNRKYECYLCRESFHSVDLLRHHIRSHIGRYNCSYCVNKFLSKQWFETHVREKHFHLFEFQCQVCQGIIKNFKCIREHERSCMQPSRESKHMVYFMCSLCGSGLPRVDDLKKHVLFGKCTKYKEKLKKLRKEKRLKIIQLRKEPQRIQLKPLKIMINGQIKLKCPLCEYTKDRQSGAFKGHFRKHTGEHPYHCPYCERSFKVIISVSRHIKANHPTKPVFQCALCRQIIYKANEINEHEFRCIRRRSLECVFCKFKKEWSKLYVFKDHMKKAHINEEAFKCRICKKSFMTRGNLNTHILNIHHISSSDRKYECYLCKEICLSFKVLRENHMKTHTIEMSSRIELEPLETVINGKKIFKCPLCEFKRPAPNPKEFAWHFEKHTGKKLHHCLYCERSFKHSSKLVAHTKLVHPTKPTLKCALCRLTFYRPDEINEHEFRCKKRRSLECVFCKFQTEWPNIRLMKDHMGKFHTGETAYKCKICAKTYWRLGYLIGHMKKTHPDTLPHECSYCRTKFSLQRTLQYHEKKCKASCLRVECFVCGYSTPKLTFNELKIHMQEHNNEKAC